MCLDTGRTPAQSGGATDAPRAYQRQPEECKTVALGASWYGTRVGPLLRDERELLLRRLPTGRGDFTATSFIQLSD